MNQAPPVVVKGKLKLKGSGKVSAPNSGSKAHAVAQTSSNDPTVLRKRKATEIGEEKIEELADEVHLTEAQRRFKQKQQERERLDAKKLVNVSYRERIDKFNEKLSKLTEHNDIPRVSAAGNG